MQLDMFPTSVHLRCVNSSQNKYRFYAMSVQPNLFGEWALIREWGRIGTTGRRRTDHFANAGEALDSLKALKDKKVKRGYQ
jgi:predicted DNA-binding WGR domain protein